MTEVEPSSPYRDDIVAESPRPIGRRGRVLSWIIGIAVLVLVVLGAVWLSHSSSSSGAGGRGGRGGGGGPGGGGRRGAGGGGPPTTVGTVKAVRADLPIEVE